MFLIMSAAYVGQELESEFGKIPPSFLPLGNRRLFQHQVKLAPHDTSVFLSIPESFLVSDVDHKWLNENNIKLIKTPDGLSLGASVIASLNLSGEEFNSSLHILFGDTLFKNLPHGDNIVSISAVKDSYNWSVVTNDSLEMIKNSDGLINSDSRFIVNGYFKFSNPRVLIRNITQSNWQFIQGLNRYNSDVGLTTIESEGWLDFGHVNTYYRSKGYFTTQRSFNELKINPTFIEKSSFKNVKISAEAHWFQNIPTLLRHYTPQFLGLKEENGIVSYSLEYLHLTALNELYVFSNLPATIWQQILKNCFEFLYDCKRLSPKKELSDNTMDELFINKTMIRIAEYCNHNNISRNKKWNYNNELCVSIEDILRESQIHLPKDEPSISILHGDFCFSNILYDFRAGRVKTIDPRGLSFKNQLTIYGDNRYDLAKLSHSILGMYDWIIAGYFSLNTHDDNINFEIEGLSQHKSTQQFFINMVENEFGLTESNLYAMQIQLFLSMLPLHSDDQVRQNALLANAFRLFKLLRRVSK